MILDYLIVLFQISNKKYNILFYNIKEKEEGEEKKEEKEE